MRPTVPTFAKMPAHAEIIIAGAGFGGTLLALILKKMGHDVWLLERSSHPRFAIGESSTPIADMVLRDLAKTYGLSWLTPLSRYGSWKQAHPELRVGLKRGFSYYFHQAGKPFTDDQTHRNSLLIAASSSDEASDTQWYRPHFDEFIVQQAVAAGVPYFDRTEIVRAAQNGPNGQWYLSLKNGKSTHEISAGFIIDATGSEQLSSMMGVKPSAYRFQTSSVAFYSHFRGVPEWKAQLEQSGIPTKAYPFHPDHAALHHLLDEGWLWMLRFSDGLLSAGFMLSYEDQKQLCRSSNEKLWPYLLGRYPSLKTLFGDAVIADPPAAMIKSKPLQRLTASATGPRSAALPHSAGFVDPMHSTGIAITLAAVEKLAAIFADTKPGHQPGHYVLESYSLSVMREIQLIDLLVAGCYKTRRHPDLFEAWLSCYFCCSISYEQARLRGERPASFLNALQSPLTGMVRAAWDDLLRLESAGFPEDESRRFTETMRNRIKPWNIAGLLTPGQKMYAHTAVEIT
ncbi:MAG: tryptophan 7-halogenase [Candidatus Cyclonatronum sp.]|uniref:NAD(P)/FAD-dependent oxidoreductase n=1 Tax=Cyclonatronum sp. TaxID=3024185 RepID=UPI0025C592F2|nr:tryptophan 7-halogenase [Cyclonatronum sp.]MCH8486168.1 tryptophan 7-halogenase [Cyclonatronum sp.]